MRIVIDMQGAQTESRFRGIGRYTGSFVEALIRNSGEHEIFLVASGLFPDTIADLRVHFGRWIPQRRILVWHAPGPVSYSGPNERRRQVAQLIREAFIASLRPDLVHITSLFEGYWDNAVTSIACFDKNTPVSVNFYDLIPLLNPEHYLVPDSDYPRFYKDKLAFLNKASLLLAISDFSRTEALDHLALDSTQVVSVSTAIGPEFTHQPLDPAGAKNLLESWGIRRPFILYTGGADRRKNLPRLITAFSRLPQDIRQSYQLVLAGQLAPDDLGSLEKCARKCALVKDDYRFVGYVSDRQLVQLYQHCRLFVFPSWHEGFGLPPLEAMACGAPVIGADATSIPEVINWRQALFDPMDTDAITTAMLRGLTDESFRDSLRRHGLQQAQRFSWDRTAVKALQAFTDLVGKVETQTTQSCPPTDLRPLYDAVAPYYQTDVSAPELFDVARSLAKIPAGNRKPRLFIDISELIQRDAKTGIQRVTGNLLRELLKRSPGGYAVTPVYATLQSAGYCYAHSLASLPFALSADVIPGSPIDFFAGDIFFGLDLQHHVVINQAGALETMRREGVRVVFMVYDLLPVHLPWAFPEGADSGHQKWLSVVARCDGAVCISRAVAAELATWLAEHHPDVGENFTIDSIHLGADFERFSASAARCLPETDNRLNQFRSLPSFLMVGTLEPRKGHAQVLDAFELLWRHQQECILVFVGKQGWMVEALVDRIRTHDELNRRLFWFEGISDAYLDKIYQACSALIAASFGEGFGLPLIEAAQRRLPIIARDISVFREVAAEHAFYFAGDEPPLLAEAVKEWLRLFANGTHPGSDEMPWLTWGQSAGELIKLLLREGEHAAE